MGENNIEKIYYLYIFKFYYKESELANYMTCYFLPNFVKKLDGGNINGELFFAQLNKNYKDKSDDIWIPVAGITRAKLENGKLKIL